jgi:double-stranded uracil-DNA glycosylase
MRASRRSICRPSAADLAAAVDRTVPDVAAPGLRVLFCGINAGLYSAAVGRHFARPGNRFWKAVHRAGFTDRLLSPFEAEEMLARGLGITNICPRTTARAEELEPDELRRGARALARKVRRLRPGAVAFLGVGAYRLAFGRPRATVGRQPERLEGAEVWVLPNPSGRTAYYLLPALVRHFRALRRARLKPSRPAPFRRAAPRPRGARPGHP